MAAEEDDKDEDDDDDDEEEEEEEEVSDTGVIGTVAIAADVVIIDVDDEGAGGNIPQRIWANVHTS